jgi:hypothetical protein
MGFFIVYISSDRVAQHLPWINSINNQQSMKLHESAKQVLLDEGIISPEIQKLYKAIIATPEYKQNTDEVACTLNDGGYEEITIKDANDKLDREGLSNMEITYGLHDRSGKYNVRHTDSNYKTIERKVDMDKALELAKSHIMFLATA